MKREKLRRKKLRLEMERLLTSLMMINFLCKIELNIIGMEFLKVFAINITSKNKSHESENS